MAICDPRDIPDWVRAAFPDDFAKPEPLRGMDTECENISMPGECVCGHTPWCNIHKDTDRPCNCGAGPARRHGNYRYMREMQRLSQDVTGIRQPARRHDA